MIIFRQASWVNFDMLQSAKRYCDFDQEHTNFDIPQFRPSVGSIWFFDQRQVEII